MKTGSLKHPSQIYSKQYSIDEIINIPVLEQVENYIVTTPAEISANPELAKSGQHKNNQKTLCTGIYQYQRIING